MIGLMVQDLGAVPRKYGAVWSSCAAAFGFPDSFRVYQTLVPGQIRGYFAVRQGILLYKDIIVSVSHTPRYHGRCLSGFS